MSVSKGDGLRIPEVAYEPDSRSTAFGLNDIADQYNKIELYTLEDYVPENVATQYEVARNLYLYAFNVYRFYMVAQHQALIALELAIKECIGNKKIKRYGEKIKKGSGLSACLHYIFDKDLVSNEDFSIWRDRCKVDAEHQYQMQKLEEMNKNGMDSIELNYDEINYEEHSLEYDYLEVLSENMPKIRNNHAHGSSTLHNQVLITFENVSVIINKIYATKSIKNST